MLIDKWPPAMRVKHTSSIKGNTIPAEAAQEIYTYLYRNYSVCTPLLIHDVDFWEWQASPDNAYGRGSWAKRVAKWYKRETLCTLSDEVMGAIGDIAGSAMKANGEYEFDFTDKIDWKSGDFGDAGSCFFYSYDNRARRSIEKHGVIAMRCYEHGKGMARAWVYTIDDGGEDGPPTLIVFNGYGKTTKEFAILLASLIGGEYKKVEVRNNGDSRGVIWINNNGTGYIVGPHEAVEHANARYDLKIKVLANTAR